MILHDFELDEAINEFLLVSRTIAEKDLQEFLLKHAYGRSGVAEKSCQILVSLSILRLNESEAKQRNHLLRALVLAAGIASDISYWADMFENESAISYWKGAGDRFLSDLCGLIQPLTQFRKALAEFGENTGQRLVLVEGRTEEVFLRVLQSTSFTASDFLILAFNGKGELKNNIAHLIREKNEQGVPIDIVYDQDGSAWDPISELMKKNVRIRRQFAFRNDFETSFPDTILAHAMTKYLRERGKKLEAVCSLDDVKNLKAGGKFIDAANKKYKLQIDKSEFGLLLGQEMIALADSKDPSVLWGEGDLLGTEIGDFLRFIADEPQGKILNKGL